MRYMDRGSGVRRRRAKVHDHPTAGQVLGCDWCDMVDWVPVMASHMVLVDGEELALCEDCYRTCGPSARLLGQVGETA